MIRNVFLTFPMIYRFYCFCTIYILFTWMRATSSNDTWKMNILGETWFCELLRCVARDQRSSKKNEPALVQNLCQTGWATVPFLAWLLCVPFFCWYINLSYPESSGYFDSERLGRLGKKEIDWSISANIFQIWSDCHASYSLFLAQIHIRATTEGNTSQRPSGEGSNQKRSKRGEGGKVK